MIACCFCIFIWCSYIVIITKLKEFGHLRIDFAFYDVFEALLLILCVSEVIRGTSVTTFQHSASMVNARAVHNDSLASFSPKPGTNQHVTDFHFHFHQRLWQVYVPLLSRIIHDRIWCHPIWNQCCHFGVQWLGIFCMEINVKLQPQMLVLQIHLKQPLSCQVQRIWSFSFPLKICTSTRHQIFCTPSPPHCYHSDLSLLSSPRGFY